MLLLKSWRKLISLEGVPEEGWHIQKIEKILNREFVPMKESSKISNKRIKKLLKEERTVDALVYSVFKKNYLFLIIIIKI